MKLEEIGFYTLSDERAKNAYWNSDLQRCELILTDRCNFKCTYCRGLRKDLRGNIQFDDAVNIIDLWVSHAVKNIRFSGGEPTLWDGLLELVMYSKQYRCIEHIALSTNGSGSIDYYNKLHEAGINDFSISFDSCCSNKFEEITKTDSYNHVIEVIKFLAQKTYVTIGIVLNGYNDQELKNTINYLTDLKVSDIRIIPSAQKNYFLKIDEIETKYKILNYRLNNIKKGRHIRGIKENDCYKCHLVMDDMAIAMNKHFPCIIYMREKGKEIGDVRNKNIMHIRLERKKWFDNMNTYENEICRKNCLDVCIDYNNKVEYFQGVEK